MGQRREDARRPPSIQGTEKEGQKGKHAAKGRTSRGREARQSEGRARLRWTLQDGAAGSGPPVRLLRMPASPHPPRLVVLVRFVSSQCRLGRAFFLVPGAGDPALPPLPSCPMKKAGPRVPWGCRDKVPQPGDLTQQQFIVCTSGGQGGFLLETQPQAPSSFWPGASSGGWRGVGGAEEGGGGGPAGSLVHTWGRASEAGAWTRES